jgi:hypothetical protein
MSGLGALFLYDSRKAYDKVLRRIRVDRFWALEGGSIAQSVRRAACPKGSNGVGDTSVELH